MRFKKSLEVCSFQSHHLCQLANVVYLLRESQDGCLKNALAALTQDLTTAHHNSTPPSLEDIQVYDRRTSPHLFFDLGDYLHALASSAEDRQRIADQMKRTVLLKRHTDFMVQLPLLRHSGLSIYVEQPSLPALNNAHRHSEWGKAITSR